MNAQNKDLLTDVLTLRVKASLETTPGQLNNLLIAANYSNIKVFFSNEAHVIGYISWLSVTKETFRVMAHTSSLPRYAHEFNEGRLKVIFDVVLCPEFAKQAKNSVVKYLKEERFVAVLKRNRLHAWYRIKSRYIKSRF